MCSHIDLCSAHSRNLRNLYNALCNLDCEPEWRALCGLREAHQRTAGKIDVAAVPRLALEVMGGEVNVRSKGPLEGWAILSLLRRRKTL